MAIPGSAPITQFREESVVGHWIPSDLENVSTNGYSWLGSDNAIPGGVGSWALDPFGPGERVTLGRGLVNQQVAPIVEVSGPFFVA
ncbi:hypothetical protein C4D60_Mb00t07840 [Musa balbisiana]|uniref:Uncharacterized protein n=1 Tax=Musa balbisiana TaxID=52838 RepID=A0A4S8I6I7_MUSBA|nr:hypothetical protein C4D60_Mb00t07840 [Musa balbisiana]